MNVCIFLTSVYNGYFFVLGSLDQPSSLAGNSFQHRFGDEARLLKKKKLDRSTPALRGEYAAFGHSVYYMGNTFTTDMPNILLESMASGLPIACSYYSPMPEFLKNFAS